MYWLASELPADIPAVCVAEAASKYKVPPVALVAILRAENGKVGKVYPRSTGTYFGPYQVSDKWLPHFARWGFTASALQNNACVNVVAGAYVLAFYKARETSWQRAIARYNVGSLDTPARREAGYRYASKVLSHWWAIHNRWAPA